MSWNARKAFRAILLANGGVAALVGTKVYHKLAPAGTAPPFLVYELLDTEPIHKMREDSTLRPVDFRLNSWSDESDEAVQVADACKTALSRYAGTISSVVVQLVTFTGESDDYEPGTERHRVIQTYTMWFVEA